MKKIKKYAVGGGMGSAQGKNKMIGDDVRARAMASIAALAKKDEESEDTKYAKRLYGGESEDTKYAKKLYSEEPELVAPKKASEIDLQSMVKKSANEGAMKKGGKVSSASKRADGCAIRGKTRA
jgi:hypothetical protein